MSAETDEPEVNGTEEPGRHKDEKNSDIISDRTANAIIAVVTSVWAGNIIAGMLKINDYQPSETINGIFMTIVGGAFVLRARGRGGD